MLTINVTSQTGNVFEMSMMENGNLLSKGSIIIDEPAELVSFDNNLNMLKALLNLADNKGVHKVICRNSEFAQTLKSIGFTEDNKQLCINLDNFFASGCKNN